MSTLLHRVFDPGGGFLGELERVLRERTDPDGIDRDGEIPPGVIAGLARLGAFGIKIPKEYGGLGLAIDKNRWPGRAESYEMVSNQNYLTDRYVEVSRRLEDLVRNDGVSAAIYTQITDVEHECNGWLTYDRNVSKIPVERLRALHQRFYQPPPVLKPIVPMSAGNQPADAFKGFSDDIVVIVHKDNTQAIDLGYVQQLYVGSVRGWPDGTPAFVLDQPNGSPGRELFSTSILRRSSANVRAIWAQNIFTGRGLPPKVAADEEIKRIVATNRNAIGYVRASQLDDSVRAIGR